MFSICVVTYLLPFHNIQLTILCEAKLPSGGRKQVGDASLGDNVNVGAGTITANYDGVRKHRTVIGDGSKTGANSVLVAPLSLGKEVTVAAGSTITKDVSDGALAIGRSRQMNKEGWSRSSGD